MECLLPYLCMVTVPHIMVTLDRMLDYRGVGLARFHCILAVLLFCSPYERKGLSDQFWPTFAKRRFII